MGVGWIFGANKTFMELHSKKVLQHSPKPGVLQVSRSPEVPIWFEVSLIMPFFKQEIFTVAAHQLNHGSWL